MIHHQRGDADKFKRMIASDIKPVNLKIQSKNGDLNPTPMRKVEEEKLYSMVIKVGTVTV